MIKKKLVKFLAKICFYSQDATRHWNEYDFTEEDMCNSFRCTSYTVASFIAKKYGCGVNPDVPYSVSGTQSILQDLIRRDFKFQTEEWWVERMSYCVDFYAMPKELLSSTK